MAKYVKPLSKPRKLADPTKPKSQSLPYRPLRFTPRTDGQRDAAAAFKDNDVLFMVGPAGVGKSFVAMALAIGEILNGNKKRIILTRPIVESGERLGFLPGTFDEKVAPYMSPLVDSITKLVGPTGSAQRELVDKSIEVRPLAYMRGATFNDAVAILDEAQNCTYGQLKLFLTRIGENCKLIIDGDPDQSDLEGEVAFSRIRERLEGVHGVEVVEFGSDEIVRHPIISRILNRI